MEIYTIGGNKKTKPIKAKKLDSRLRGNDSLWVTPKGCRTDERTAKPAIRDVDEKGGFGYCTDQFIIRAKRT